MIRALAFDFDGVLVESVDVKTRAFRRLFASDGADVTERVVDYHLRNGGVSRFEKFRYIYREILARPLSDDRFQQLCDDFATLVVEEVVAAPEVPGANAFLRTYSARYLLFVVSGTPATELRDIVARRSMTPYFREVLGAPETKDALLTGLLARYGLAPFELVFIGDAETDWRAAAATGVPFIWRCTAGNALEDGHSLAIDTMTNLTDRLRQIDPSWR